MDDKKDIQVLNAIAALIRADVLDSDGNRAFKQVLTRESNSFDGDPACTVSIKSSPAEEVMNLANIRNDTYQIKIFVATAKSVRTETAAWDLVQKLQSVVKDVLDESGYLSGLADILHPVNLIDVIEPVTGSGGNTIAIMEVINKRVVVI